MHNLPVPVALALSIMIGVATASLVMSPSARGADMPRRHAADRCGGYALLHARLSDFDTLARFVDHMDECVSTLARG